MAERRYRLEVEVPEGQGDVPAGVLLRRLLKHLLRVWRIKCRVVEEVKAEGEREEAKSHSPSRGTQEQ